MCTERVIVNEKKGKSKKLAVNTGFMGIQEAKRKRDLSAAFPISSFGDDDGATVGASSLENTQGVADGYEKHGTYVPLYTTNIRYDS